MGDFEQRPNVEILLASLVQEVHGLRAAVEAMAIANSPEPRMVKPLDEYENFDWSSINASVMARDKSGPTVVEWGGFQWKRRSRDDYGADIFFTRPNGKMPDGKVRYVRLITFKGEMGKVKPVPEATREALAERAEARRMSEASKAVTRTIPPQAQQAQAQPVPAQPSPAQPSQAQTRTQPAKRSWPGAFVQLVIRSGVVKAPQEAVGLLNLSKLSTKDPEDVVIKWIGAYHKAIEDGEVQEQALFLADTTLPQAARGGACGAK